MKLHEKHNRNTKKTRFPVRFQRTQNARSFQEIDVYGDKNFTHPY